MYIAVKNTINKYQYMHLQMKGAINKSTRKCKSVFIENHKTAKFSKSEIISNKIIECYFNKFANGLHIAFRAGFLSLNLIRSRKFKYIKKRQTKHFAPPDANMFVVSSFYR